MKNQNDLIIPSQTLELCQLRPESPLSLCAGKNTLVVIPERMTAMETVNAINVLTGLASDLIEAVQAACGTCEERKEGRGCPFAYTCDPGECPYAEVEREQAIERHTP